MSAPKNRNSGMEILAAGGCILIGVSGMVFPIAAVAQDGCAGLEVCIETVDDAVVLPTVESQDAAVPVVGTATVVDTQVSTRTYSAEQERLADRITSNLKSRRLTSPAGDNALQHIEALRELQPYHDYSVNGEKYIARIYLSLGLLDFEQDKFQSAAAKVKSAVEFDPEIAGAAELKEKITNALKTGKENVEEKEIDESELIATGADSDDTTEKSSEEGKAAITDETDEKTASIVAAEEPELTQGSAITLPEMVSIPGGSFLMGSESGADDEKPVRTVVVPPFSMSKYEVTIQQYVEYLQDTGSLEDTASADETSRPATDVSWIDAQAYAEWLSEKTNKSFRLPTEAEWEYAARAGTSTDYFFGDELINNANCVDCNTDWDNKGTAPVGSFDENAFGLFDMHGNVWEWVQDCLSSDYSSYDNTSKAVEENNCDKRVMRGGAWYNESEYATSSYRGAESPEFKDSGVGLRLVID